MVRFPIPVLACCMIGCGDGDGGPAPDSPEATLEGPDVPLVAVTEELFLLGGGLSEEEWQAFTEISEVHFDHDGDLVILDRRQNRVVVVGSDGEFRRHISRTGQGPGEFRMAIGVGVLHDNRIVVRDVGHNALLLFGADGNFLEQHVAIREPPRRVQSQSVISSSQTLPALLGSFPDGRLLTARRRGARALDIHTIGRGSREVYQAYTPAPSEVARSEGVSIRIGEMEVPLPGGLMPRRTVFGPPLLAAVLADGEIAVVDSVGYRVKIVRPDDGSVRTVLERPIDPIPVTAEMQEAARERESGGGGAQVIATGPGISGAAGRELSSALAQSLVPEMDFGSEVPVISEMAVDRENRIWIVRSGEDGISPGPVDVLTPSGGYLGTLSEGLFRIPDAFGPDGLMAYVELDEFDVPVLRVVRLVSLTVDGG